MLLFCPHKALIGVKESDFTSTVSTYHSTNKAIAHFMAKASILRFNLCGHLILRAYMKTIDIPLSKYYKYETQTSTQYKLSMVEENHTRKR